MKMGGGREGAWIILEYYLLYLFLYGIVLLGLVAAIISKRAYKAVICYKNMRFTG